MSDVKTGIFENFSKAAEGTAGGAVGMIVDICISGPEIKYYEYVIGKVE